MGTEGDAKSMWSTLLQMWDQGGLGAAELCQGERGHFLQAPAVVWEVIQSFAVPFLASSPERDYL